MSDILPRPVAPNVLLNGTPRMRENPTHPFPQQPALKAAQFTLAPAKQAMELYASGKKLQAIEVLQGLHKNVPSVAEFPATIASIYHELGMYKNALHWHDITSKYRNLRPEILSNHANTLRAMGFLLQSLELHKKALRRDPRNSFILNNQGCVYTEIGDLHKAITCFDRAISNDPRCWNAYFNKGNAMLLGGDYSREAWEYYDYRGLCAELATYQQLPFPWWLGEGQPLDGKSLFIEVEQGHGDTFQFSRYLFALRDKYPTAEITFQVADPLYEIMRANFGGIVDVAPGEISLNRPYDYRLLLMHLPRVFPDYTGFSPYLKPLDPPRGRNGKFSIGLCWRGNPEHKNDHNRSCHTFPDMAPGILAMGRSDTLQFYSLQQGEALSDFAPSLPIYNWADTFRFVSQLDLIITVDTSIAHVAGALGKPVWLMLPKAPDWRWGLEGDTSRWYPTMKIYRQPLRGDWKSVIEKISRDLAEHVGISATAPKQET